MTTGTATEVRCAAEERPPTRWLTATQPTAAITATAATTATVGWRCRPDITDHARPAANSILTIVGSSPISSRPTPPAITNVLPATDRPAEAPAKPCQVAAP